MVSAFGDDGAGLGSVSHFHSAFEAAIITPTVAKLRNSENGRRSRVLMNQRFMTMVWPLTYPRMMESFGNHENRIRSIIIVAIRNARAIVK